MSTKVLLLRHMKKEWLLCSVFVITFLSALKAQVTFVVQSLPAYTPVTDSLYIAGSFNGWEPGSAAHMLHKNAQGKWAITLDAQASGTTIKFKFTRGSWATVEKGASGEEISDRSYTFGGAANVDVSILNWADNSGGGNSTAASNVKIISTNFFIPQLNRTRRIWMYFPPDYETSARNYPVIYMHDGQNLFDAGTSFSGEWEVDETLNKLASEGKSVPLVVGIDNGGSFRIGEYTPWANTQYGGGDGDKYMSFIVETLKPFIDQNYRTLSDRDNTALLGSSLGGLISQFGALKYQHVFGKAGLFSPSYWYSDSLWSFTHEQGKQYSVRFYQLCGNNESSGLVADMQRMNDSLVKLGFGQENILNKIVPGGQHNEKLWRESFGEAYVWLFTPYANEVQESAISGVLKCFPNPVDDILAFSTPDNTIFDTIYIVDSRGSIVLSNNGGKDNRIDISGLPSGIYFLMCKTADKLYEARFIKN